MAFDQQVLLTETLDLRGDKYGVVGAGRIIVGSSWDRPVEYVAGVAQKAGIKAPYYPKPYGGPDADTDGAITCTFTPDAGGQVLDGWTVRVREVFWRVVGGYECRSNPGKVFEFLNSSGASTIAIKSTCRVLGTEANVNHREFYIEYLDSDGTSLTGGFFLAAQISYSGATAGDETPSLNWSAELLIQQRPLEDALQCSIFPAVATMTFWKGMFIGGGERPRIPMYCTVSFAEGSNVVSMSGYQTWLEADLYKAITFVGLPVPSGSGPGGWPLKSGEVFGYVTQILSDTDAVVQFAPQWADDDGNWRYDDIDFTNPATTASTINFKLDTPGNNDLKASPIYVGEAAQGITYGYLTWAPDNELRDQQQLDSAGRVVLVATAGEDLVVCYEKGVTVISGDYAVGIPFSNYRMFPVSQEIGTFNPLACWHDADRVLWFQGTGRLWRVEGNRVVDASKEMLTAFLYPGQIYNSGDTLTDQRAAFNGQRNASLMVGLTRGGETADADKYKYAYYFCQDRRPTSVHPLRYPVPVTAACSTPSSRGSLQFDQWFLGSGNRVYKFADPQADASDTYYDADDVLVENEPIALVLGTGIKVCDWEGLARAVRLLFNSGSDATEFVIDVLGYYGNDTAYRDSVEPITASSTSMTITRHQASIEAAFNNPVAGHCLQVGLRGNNGGAYFSLYRIELVVEQTPPRLA